MTRWRYSQDQMRGSLGYDNDPTRCSTTPSSERRPWYDCRNSAPWMLHFTIYRWDNIGRDRRYGVGTISR